jgi:hypothetical protein
MGAPEFSSCEVGERAAKKPGNNAADPMTCHLVYVHSDVNTIQTKAGTGEGLAHVGLTCFGDPM